MTLGIDVVARAAEIDGVESFTIKTNDMHKDVPGCNLSDWRFVFAAVRGGAGNAVKHFTSRDELVDYSNKKFDIMTPPRKNSDKVSNLIADRIEEKMDFAKNDLVIVNLHTGGPPFGKLRQELKDGTLHIWMQKPVAGGRRGLALKIVFKFYKIPKGLRIMNTPPSDAPPTRPAGVRASVPIGPPLKTSARPQKPGGTQEKTVIEIRNADDEPGLKRLNQFTNIFGYGNDQVWLQCSFSRVPFGGKNVLAACRKSFKYCNVEIRFPDRATEKSRVYAQLRGPLRTLGKAKDFGNMKNVKLTFSDFADGRLTGTISGTITSLTTRTEGAGLRSGDIAGVGHVSNDANIPFVVNFDLSID